jgi:hypothetical protein
MNIWLFMWRNPAQLLGAKASSVRDLLMTIFTLMTTSFFLFYAPLYDILYNETAIFIRLLCVCHKLWTLLKLGLVSKAATG